MPGHAEVCVGLGALETSIRHAFLLCGLPSAQLYNHGKGFLASDTGAVDVMANKSDIFSVTGNFNRQNLLRR